MPTGKRAVTASARHTLHGKRHGISNGRNGTRIKNERHRFFTAVVTHREREISNVSAKFRTNRRESEMLGKPVISLNELLGRICTGNAPKEISYNGTAFVWDEEQGDYFSQDDNGSIRLLPAVARSGRREDVAILSEPTLTDEEREYLSAVLHPFRERFIFLEKKRGDIDLYTAVIKIRLSRTSRLFSRTDELTMPPFPQDKYYTGLAFNYKYSLSQLGLFGGKAK